MISLRPITDADLPFLYALYASTRAEELARVPWSEEQKAAFLAQQFSAQHQYWQENYRDTRWDLVEADGEPIGRFYVARWAAEIRILDIALIPERRGGGLATTLIGDLLAEADATGRPVTIHVEMYTPARRLYERLGFRQVDGGTGVYLKMERPPAGAGAAAPRTHEAGG